MNGAAEQLAQGVDAANRYADDIEARTGVDPRKVEVGDGIKVQSLIDEGAATITAALSTGAAVTGLLSQAGVAASTANPVGLVVAGGIVAYAAIQGILDAVDCSEKADAWHDKYKEAVQRVQRALGTRGADGAIVEPVMNPVIWYRVGEMAPVACDSKSVKATITWGNHADGKPSREYTDPLIGWSDGSRGKKKGVNERLRYEYCEKYAVMKGHTQWVRSLADSLETLDNQSDRRFLFETTMLLYLPHKSHAMTGLWGSYEPVAFRADGLGGRSDTGAQRTMINESWQQNSWISRVAASTTVLEWPDLPADRPAAVGLITTQNVFPGRQQAINASAWLARHPAMPQTAAALSRVLPTAYCYLPPDFGVIDAASWTIGEDGTLGSEPAGYSGFHANVSEPGGVALGSSAFALVAVRKWALVQGQNAQHVWVFVVPGSGIQVPPEQFSRFGAGGPALGRSIAVGGYRLTDVGIPDVRQLSDGIMRAYCVGRWPAEFGEGAAAEDPQSFLISILARNNGAAFYRLMGFFPAQFDRAPAGAAALAQRNALGASSNSRTGISQTDYNAAHRVSAKPSLAKGTLDRIARFKRQAGVSGGTGEGGSVGKAVVVAGIAGLGLWMASRK